MAFSFFFLSIFVPEKECVCVCVDFCTFLGGKGIKCCSAFLINDLVPWGIWWDLLAKECHGIPHFYSWKTKSGTPAILNPRSPRAGGRGSGHIALQSPPSLVAHPHPTRLCSASQQHDLHNSLRAHARAAKPYSVGSCRELVKAQGMGTFQALSSLISIQSNAMPLFS